MGGFDRRDRGRDEPRGRDDRAGAPTPRVSTGTPRCGAADKTTLTRGAVSLYTVQVAVATLSQSVDATVAREADLIVERVMTSGHRLGRHHRRLQPSTPEAAVGPLSTAAGARGHAVVTQRVAAVVVAVMTMGKAIAALAIAAH
jgi:hypothetical protein